MLNNKDILEDIFVIPHRENFIIYAPLKKKVILVNKSALVLLKKFAKDPDTKISETLLSLLKSENVVELSTKSPLPHKLNLLLTSDCNLRCKYCYSEAGKTKFYMQWETAKAAIDFITERILEEKKKELVVYFQGGGEPTLNWDILIKSVEYGKEIAKKHGLKTNFRITTNGVFNEKKARWLAENLDFVTLSFDGPKDIHDYNRPFLNGRGSFDTVLRTAKLWDTMGFEYDIHATIPRIFVNRMSECVKFFAENTKSKLIGFFETEFSGYAASRSDMQPPLEEEFVNNFLRAKKIGEEKGNGVYCAKTNPLYLLTHLRGSEKVFTVTPTNFVTAINEVDDITKPNAEKYIYGKYVNGEFVIFWNKLNELDRTFKKNIELCKRCFCLYNCFLKGMKFDKCETQEKFIKRNAKKCSYVREIMKNELIILVEKT